MFSFFINVNSPGCKCMELACAIYTFQFDKFMRHKPQKLVLAQSLIKNILWSLCIPPSEPHPSKSAKPTSIYISLHHSSLISCIVWNFTDIKSPTRTVHKLPENTISDSKNAPHYAAFTPSLDYMNYPQKTCRDLLSDLLHMTESSHNVYKCLFGSSELQ
jgi:hypothetical protein